MRECSHLSQVRPVSPSSDGCAGCLAAGDVWVHLRLCRGCGHVGCCDSSRNRHATKHFEETGHAIASSLEPGEIWSWCYEDQTTVDVSG